MNTAEPLINFRETNYGQHGGFVFYTMHGGPLIDGEGLHIKIATNVKYPRINIVDGESPEPSRLAELAIKQANVQFKKYLGGATLQLQYLNILCKCQPNSDACKEVCKSSACVRSVVLRDSLVDPKNVRSKVSTRNFKPWTMAPGGDYTIARGQLEVASIQWSKPDGDVANCAVKLRPKPLIVIEQSGDALDDEYETVEPTPLENRKRNASQRLREEKRDEPESSKRRRSSSNSSNGTVSD